MHDTKMVIIEGGSYTLPLSLYLSRFHGFTLIKYDVDSNSFARFITSIVFGIDHPRLCITPGHLTALARNQITVAWFKEFESAVALTGCKLILTTARDLDPPGYLAAPYAASWLEKMALNDSGRVDDVVDWLGLGMPERQDGKIQFR